MLCLSENDLKNFIASIIRNVARELKVKDWERQTYYTLVKQIKTENPEVSKKLEGFYNAYKKWHDLQVKLGQESQVGVVAAADKDKLQHYLLTRDAAREALLAELHK